MERTSEINLELISVFRSAGFPLQLVRSDRTTESETGLGCKQTPVIINSERGQRHEERGMEGGWGLDCFKGRHEKGGGGAS